VALVIQWFNSLPSPSQAALIGALVGGLAGAAATLLTGVLRDFVAKWWSDRRDENRSADDVYRRYAEPLAISATSLMWRLTEMFGRDGRASFLVAREPRTEFEEYKLRSTYYRLAALLGWLRALRRELSFLRLASKRRIDVIEDAIDNLERSLADGHHVEIQRLAGLLQIWTLPAVNDEKLSRRLAVDLENCVKRTLQSAPVASPLDLSADRQVTLCRDCAGLICANARFAPVAEDILVETRSRAIRQIAIREAWLYRDWQAAIGDLVLRESTAGNRRFEVLGFGDFEAFMLGPTPAQYRLLCRVGALFQGVNLDQEDSFDARPETLRSLLRATATLVQGIGRVPVSAPLLSTASIAAADRILQEGGRPDDPNQTRRPVPSWTGKFLSIVRKQLVRRG
jgi:hypothetical protein